MEASVGKAWSNGAQPHHRSHFKTPGLATYSSSSRTLFRLSLSLDLTTRATVVELVASTLTSQSIPLCQYSVLANCTRSRWRAEYGRAGSLA